MAFMVFALFMVSLVLLFKYIDKIEIFLLLLANWNLFAIAGKAKISLLLFVKLKFLVLLVKLKSLGGADKTKNVFPTTSKIEIFLQLLIELKFLNGVNKTIQSFCCCLQSWNIFELLLA